LKTDGRGPREGNKKETGGSANRIAERTHRFRAHHNVETGAVLISTGKKDMKEFEEAN